MYWKTSSKCIIVNGSLVTSERLWRKHGFCIIMKVIPVNLSGHLIYKCLLNISNYTVYILRVLWSPINPMICCIMLLVNEKEMLWLIWPHPFLCPDYKTCLLPWQTSIWRPCGSQRTSHSQCSSFRLRTTSTQERRCWPAICCPSSLLRA